MSSKSRQRQDANRAARAAQAAGEARRQLWLRVGVIVIVVAVVGATLAVFLTSNGDSSNAKSAGTTTTQPSSTTVAAMPSAAGKPCVATAGPLPTGAPAVPVQVGPPPTALVKQDLKVGTGATVDPTSTITVNYIGVACSTGQIFDSSYSRNQPATFPLNNVIPGWSQGLAGMKVGGERLLGIPPALAYGSQGSPPQIAPDETLWFVVDVTDAKPS